MSFSHHETYSIGNCEVVLYLKDVVFAANDEQRNRKGTDQLSVLLTESQLTQDTCALSKEFLF